MGPRMVRARVGDFEPRNEAVGGPEFMVKRGSWRPSESPRFTVTALSSLLRREHGHPRFEVLAEPVPGDVERAEARRVPPGRPQLPGRRPAPAPRVGPGPRAV